jgi:hypothetical protein
VLADGFRGFLDAERARVVRQKCRAVFEPDAGSLGKAMAYRQCERETAGLAAELRDVPDGD